MKVVAVLCLLASAVYGGVILPATTLIRTPQHDSAVIKSERLGGNFAYSHVEAPAYAAVSPVVTNVHTPVGVSYHATPVQVPVVAPAIRTVAAVPAVAPAYVPAVAPSIHAVPAIHTLPAVSHVPAIHTLPAVSHVPVVSHVPAVSHVPVVSHIPAVSHVPAVSHIPALSPLDKPIAVPEGDSILVEAA